jgi:hypothetical protein
MSAFRLLPRVNGTKRDLQIELVSPNLCGEISWPLSEEALRPNPARTAQFVMSALPPKADVRRET